MQGNNTDQSLHNRYVVSETYDLLSPNAPISKQNGLYLLQRPSRVPNLKEVCFRSFNPIMKKSIANLQDSNTINITIYPAIVSNYDGNGYNVYVKSPIDSVGNSSNSLIVNKTTNKCEFAGTIDGIVKNINETIASYCDNIKNRNATFEYRLMNGNTETTTFYLADPADITNEISIFDYVNSQTPPDSPLKYINPNINYVKLRYDEQLQQFFTEHVLFKLVNKADNTKIITLAFIVEITWDPYDLFNVSAYREYFNIASFNGSGAYPNYIDDNDCISTNENFENQLTALNYKYNGIDLCLRSSLMRNLTGIVYVNKTEAQITMKGSQESATTSYIPVTITDINNKVIDTSYLESIYSSIIIDLDFIFEGIL